MNTFEILLNKAEEKDTGIACPKCNCSQTAVIDSREANALGKGSIRRRRKCLRCSYRWRTYEISSDTLKEIRKSINKTLKVRV